MLINREALGRLIKERRMTQHFTQEKLAENIDKSTNYIGNIERGNDNPSLQVFVDICNTLCVSPNELLIDSITVVKDLHAEKNNRILMEIQNCIQEISPECYETLLEVIKNISTISNLKNENE